MFFNKFNEKLTVVKSFQINERSSCVEFGQSLLVDNSQWHKQIKQGDLLLVLFKYKINATPGIN